MHEIYAAIFGGCYFVWFILQVRGGDAEFALGSPTTV